MFKRKNLTDSGKAAPHLPRPRIACYRLIVFVSLGCILLASSAHADTIIYNDTTHAGGHVLNGGATEISGDDVTKMLADEITVAAGYGGARISGLS